MKEFLALWRVKEKEKKCRIYPLPLTVSLLWQIGLIYKQLERKRIIS